MWPPSRRIDAHLFDSETWSHLDPENNWYLCGKRRCWDMSDLIDLWLHLLKKLTAQVVFPTWKITGRKVFSRKVFSFPESYANPEQGEGGRLPFYEQLISTLSQRTLHTKADADPIDGRFFISLMISDCTLRGDEATTRIRWLVRFLFPKVEDFVRSPQPLWTAQQDAERKPQLRNSGSAWRCKLECWSLKIMRICWRYILGLLLVTQSFFDFIIDRAKIRVCPHEMICSDRRNKEPWEAVEYHHIRCAENEIAK